MNNEQELTSEKSLEIIHQMISKAKVNITDNGIGWLLWGSLIFLASICTFFLALNNHPDLFLAWNVFGVISVILLIYQFTKTKKRSVRTYVDDVLHWVDLGFTISLFIIIISMNVLHNVGSGFGYLLMLYAFLMIIQGGALKFRPLIIGAVINWVGAIAIFINTDFKYDMLISAAAVFIGYIIPGLLLRSKSKKIIPSANQHHGL
ncbi:MAG: hypothetical protein WKF35_05640 [Ferruginibacter sp.]